VLIGVAMRVVMLTTCLRNCRCLEPAGTEMHLLQSTEFLVFSGVLITSVWWVFGLYCKVLNRVPRHRQILERVMGIRWGWLIVLVGIGEMLIGVWVQTGWERPACAVVQTVIILTMNLLEICFAGDLLISAPRMVALNGLLLAVVWNWAIAQR